MSKREGGSEASVDSKTNSAKLSWVKVEPLGSENKEMDIDASKFTNVSRIDLYLCCVRLISYPV
jgi:hypothetical protein